MAYLRKILVVDDSVMNRKILNKILSSMYEIIEAENGQEALTILDERVDEISLVLLDIVMPIMDGYTFLEKVKENSKFNSIPVIVTTQKDSEEDEVKALSLGATDFITKPYKTKIIKHRIASIINLSETSMVVNNIRYDQLTNVYSKEYFYQMVKNILKNNSDKSYDIIVADIENFKIINDMFGSKKGDQLLIKLASLCRDYSVETRSCCGRIGSDIFGLIREHRSNYDKKEFDELISALNDSDIKSLVKVNFGIYHISDPTITVSKMCDRARMASEKIKGKFDISYMIYDQSMRAEMLSEQSIVDDMLKALHNHEYIIYLQPKYNIQTNTISGAEALVRWNHPKKGILPPGQFIEFFEKNGFISMLDHYVWEEACKTLYDLKQHGITDLPISVNVSRIDLYNINLPEEIKMLCDKYDIPPSLLHLEVTESAYNNNFTQIIDITRRLKDHGFMIELDDFGTGYSSLSMLDEIPIDILKLDMSFVQKRIYDDKKNILQFIINLSKWMEIPVIAEGVETKEQLLRLLSLGCECVQGYYFSKPLPYEQFIELLEKELLE